MGEQSTRDEMSAAIRGARERHAVPRSMAPEAPPEPVAQLQPEPAPEPAKPKGRLSRLLGR